MRWIPGRGRSPERAATQSEHGAVANDSNDYMDRAASGNGEHDGQWQNPQLHVMCEARGPEVQSVGKGRQRAMHMDSSGFNGNRHGLEGNELQHWNAGYDRRYSRQDSLVGR